MADKKITALSDMAAIGKESSEDLLHIIDYGGGSSPINKKITVANLFSKVNTSTQIYAASSEFEIGLTDATVSVLKAFVGASATAASGVIINEDQNDLTDFTVKTQNSAQAIFVDSSDDSGAGNVNYVKINGDSAAIDFQVYSDTGILIHTDAPDNAVGIGTSTPSANYMLDVIADATTGHSAHFAGNILMSGKESAVVTAGTIAVTKPITYISIDGTKAYTLADGVDGQIKQIIVTVAANTPLGTITPTNCAGGNVSSGAGILLDAVGEAVTLLFTNSKWNVISLRV